MPRSALLSLVLSLVLILALILAACAPSTPVSGAGLPDLPEFDPAQFEQRLAGSDRPMVVNVWASWCIPCRSEAPLLALAYTDFGDRVEFVGVAIEDSQPAARQFLAEFEIPYENLFDPPAEVREQLGGQGIPITYFVAPGGEVVDAHFGVIDERALALGIDELLLHAER